MSEKETFDLWVAEFGREAYVDGYPDTTSVYIPVDPSGACRDIYLDIDDPDAILWQDLYCDSFETFSTSDLCFVDSRPITGGVTMYSKAVIA